MPYFMVQPFAGFSVEQVPEYNGCLQPSATVHGKPRLMAWHEARNYLLNRLRQVRVLAPVLPQRDDLTLQLAGKLHEVVKATLLAEEPNFPEFDPELQPVLPFITRNQHLLLLGGGINENWWRRMPEEQPSSGYIEQVWLTVLGDKRLRVRTHLEFRLLALRRPPP